MKYIVLGVVVVLVIVYFTRSANNKKVAQQNMAIGQEFLASKRADQDIAETASGLQYQVLKSGHGNTHPTASSKVKVHYHGTLIDGTVFDSSVERGEPLSFPLNQVIKGWTEGVQLMVEGDKFKFFIPANLAYGNNTAGKIAPGSLLIFEVELLEIQ